VGAVLRVNLTDDDAVLACLPTAWGDDDVVAGSTVVPCAECGRDVWRAPGAPLDDHGRPAIGVDVDRLVVLCLPCARMHLQLAGGQQ
jgi:hypothetical protein